MNQLAIQELLSEADKAAKRSYSPYSKEREGAALLTWSGKTFTGCTVDNAAYPNSICAMRNAIVNLMSSELGDQEFDTQMQSPIKACAFIDANKNTLSTPCGMCRQCLVEFGDFPVYLGHTKNESEDEYKYTQAAVTDLLPFYTKPPQIWNPSGTYSASEWWKDLEFKSYKSSDGERTPDFLPDLIKSAVNAAKKAYIPISYFPVGAALLTDKGVFEGANVENTSLQATVCAERTAISKAINGGARKFKSMAVFCIKITDHYAKPCGGCRQSLVEFGDFNIYCFCYKGDGVWMYEATTSLQLLPDAFTPADLK